MLVRVTDEGTPPVQHVRTWDSRSARQPGSYMLCHLALLSRLTMHPNACLPHLHMHPGQILQFVRLPHRAHGCSACTCTWACPLTLCLSAQVLTSVCLTGHNGVGGSG